MEINVYGIASINLDKANDITIKRFLITALIVYLGVIGLVTILPDRVIKENLGDAQFTSNQNEASH